jgi:hypothetical protein
MQCAACLYNIGTSSCCDCVARAISAYGGTYDGPWPGNLGWPPPKPSICKRR